MAVNIVKEGIGLFDPIVYPVRLFVEKSSNQDFLDKYETLDNEFVSPFAESGYTAVVHHCIVRHKETQRIGVLVYIRENASVAIIAHKAVHVAHNMFKYLGIEYTMDCDEHFAYLVGWAAHCIEQVNNQPETP